MAMMGIIDEPNDRLQRIGNIKMGRKGKELTKTGSDDTYRLPEKFDHFEITTMERDDDGDWLPDQYLIEILGKNPKAIPVILPFDDIMEILPHEFAWWRSSKRMCHGNGVTAFRYNEADDTETQMDCRCELFTGAGGVKRVCKKNAILNVIITASGRIGGVYQLRTTSGTTISNIKASINLIQSFTGGPIAGIPLMLTIQKQFAYPVVQGTKRKVEIYVAGLEFRADSSLAISPTEQLLERAGVQIQGRLSVSKDVRQIEQFSVGNINRNTPEDDLDWEQEFGEGARSGGIEDEIDATTGKKTSELKQRLSESEEAKPQEEPAQQQEPTTTEIKQNLRTEIETLLEDSLLSKEIIGKTAEWLKKGRTVKSLNATRDKLIETIEQQQQKQSRENDDAGGAGEADDAEAAEEVAAVKIRSDIAELLKSEELPGGVVYSTTKWLRTKERSAEDLGLVRDNLDAKIQTYQKENAAILPRETGDDGEVPGGNGDALTIVEAGSRVIDLLGQAREEGLATEQEHSAVFDEADRLRTMEDMTALYDKWESEINDRRLIRESDRKRSGSK